jgi:hypothetical protein
MKAFWSDPYMWIHLAGIAAVPFWLLLCALGLAAGDPILPIDLEIFLVAVLGAVPVVYMQSERPFCIYSLLFVGLRPAAMTVEQRRMLSLFRSRRNSLTMYWSSVLLSFSLEWLASLSGIATSTTFVPGHLVGLFLAIGSFLAANLLLQVPLSVIQVMRASDAEFAQTPPYDVTLITRDFFALGRKVERILPQLEPDPN